MTGPPPVTAVPAAVVDASVWTSRFVVQDVHHVPSRQWLEAQMTGGGLVIAPTLLLTEVAGAVARRSGDPGLAHRVVRDILLLTESRLVGLDRRLGADAARLAADLRLRGADAVYVAVAHSLQIPLITWDREQLTRAAGRIALRTPWQR